MTLQSASGPVSQAYTSIHWNGEICFRGRLKFDEAGQSLMAWSACVARLGQPCHLLARPLQAQRRACGTVSDAVVHHAEAVFRAKSPPLEFHGSSPESIIPLHAADVQFTKGVLSQHEAVSNLVAEGKPACHESPDEVRERVTLYLESMKGQEDLVVGHRIFRDAVARFLTHRDGTETPPESIFMTSGTWPAARALLQVLLLGSENAVALLPSPGPPAYRETAASMGQRGVPYFVDDDWAKVLLGLRQTLEELHRHQKQPTAVVVANPSLAGRFIPLTAVEALLRLADEEGLALIVEEDIIAAWRHSAFVSFRVQARQMNLAVPVFSSFSAFAYTGQHGGYVHCHCVPDDLIQRVQAVAEHPTVKSQAWVASLLSPWRMSRGQETSLDTLVQVAAKNCQLLQKLCDVEGIRCDLVESGAFAFPKVIVKGFIMKKAISLARPADQVYCLEMVSRTGVIVSPGSGFGQRPGFFHFRVSLVQEEATFQSAIDHIKQFHQEHPVGWFR